MAKKGKYYQRSDGLYETSRTINGKRVKFRGKTCREVDRKILEYQEKKEKGRTFYEVAEAWWNEKEPSMTAGTMNVYLPPFRRAKDYFTGYVKEIRPIDVQNFILRFERQGYAKKTVTTQKSVVTQIFSYAVMCGDIDYSPASEVKISRNLPQKKRKALTVEQERAVQEYRGKDWLLGMMLLYTGCRRGELLALTWQDIDREAGVIHIDKKLSWNESYYPIVEHHLKSENGRREIPLLAPLAAVLPRNRVGIIFAGVDGYLNLGEIRKMWKDYVAAVGLDGITPHCFRHSFATICYEAGVDSKSAAAFLGDTEIVTQNFYQELRGHHHLRGVELLNTYLAARDEQQEA